MCNLVDSSIPDDPPESPQPPLRVVAAVDGLGQGPDPGLEADQPAALLRGELRQPRLHTLQPGGQPRARGLLALAAQSAGQRGQVSQVNVYLRYQNIKISIISRYPKDRA